MKKKSLYDALVDYKNLDYSSFHTPGHKNNFFKNEDLFSLDYTELPLTDSLYEASGIIKNSEEKLSRIYGTKASFFSSGGNTLCIQSMIKMTCGFGGKILCDRLVHRSAVSTMAMLDLTPVWVKRNIKNNIAWDINIEDLKEKLKKNRDAKAFYITSPNYYGVIQDVSLISSICSNYNIPLIVDNAHGSHLKFFGLHPIDKGASISADSAHKTLPVMTSGAFLHVNSQKYKNMAKTSMSLFGSTSPSYPIMASMDICLKWIEKFGNQKYELLSRRIENLKKSSLFEDAFLNGIDIDPIRITINTKKIGYSGYEFRNELYKFKIEPEFCDENYIVLIATPFNREKDWNRLESAIKNIEIKRKFFNFEKSETKIPKSQMKISKALSLNSKEIDLEKCLGKIAAEIICPCPPGVPVVMPGEKIEEEEIASLKKYGISKLCVIE